MTQVITSRLDVFNDLAEKKKIGSSFRTIKDRVKGGLPKMRCAVLIEDTSYDPPQYTYKKDLLRVPAELWKNKIDGNRRYTLGKPCLYHVMTWESTFRLLRQDVMTTIAEVKAFHRRVCLAQERSYESFLSDCQSVDLSVDGVKESNHGPRKFVFVTARFGKNWFYLLKIMNPLMGDNMAKPSPEDLIGYLFEREKILHQFFKVNSIF